MSRPGGVPVRHRGAAVVQACALMTPEDLAGLGLTVRGGVAPGMVSRNLIDGTGDVAPYYLEGSQAPNCCGYATGETGLVYVAVHQPAYAGSAALDRHLRDRFGAPVDRGGCSSTNRCAHSVT